MVIYIACKFGAPFSFFVVLIDYACDLFNFGLFKMVLLDCDFGRLGTILVN